ncbi:MAG: hypothetical protein IJN05_05100 [Ruminococcus sp.]|nr:hypothetical protein [Ruminococcus sp.]
MKKDLCKMIFNADNTTKTNAFFLIIGIIITSIAAVIYFFNYTKINIEQLLKFENQIILMFFSVIAFFVGITFLISILNLNNPTIRFILVLILGASIYAVIREEPIRLAFAILLLSFVIFVVTKIFSKVFSTIITFSLSCLFAILFLKLLLVFIPQIQTVTSLYISIASMLLFYNILGVKLNQLCLKYILGYSIEKIKRYDSEELKNQINLLYLVLFVMLNLSLIYSEQNDISLIGNCVNNALVTGVCITNVHWKSLFWANNR